MHYFLQFTLPNSKRYIYPKMYFNIGNLPKEGKCSKKTTLNHELLMIIIGQLYTVGEIRIWEIRTLPGHSIDSREKGAKYLGDTLKIM